MLKQKEKKVDAQTNRSEGENRAIVSTTDTLWLLPEIPKSNLSKMINKVSAHLSVYSSVQYITG